MCLTHPRSLNSFTVKKVIRVTPFIAYSLTATTDKSQPAFYTALLMPELLQVGIDLKLASGANINLQIV